MPKNILKLSYTLAICILLTVLFTSYWAVRQSLSTKENDSTIINVAGRQRMLSQRITQLALRLVATNDTVQKKSISFQLQKTLALWQQSHQALKFGDPKLNIVHPENKEAILFQLNEIDNLLNSIVQSCNSILHNEKSKEEALNTIIKNQDVFLPKMDAIVKTFENRSEEKLQFTKNLQTGLLLLSLLVVFFEGIFIFKPALDKINRYIKSLQLLDSKLKESERLFKNAFQYSAIGVTISTINHQLIQVNESVCKILGYSSEELLTKTLDELASEEDKKIDAALQSDLLAGKISSYKTEKRYVHKNGSIIWILLAVSIILDDENNPYQIVSQLENITATKDAEILLQNERQLLRTIIDNIPINVYVKDTNSRKVLVNKSEILHMNMDESEILGKSDVELYPYESAKISIEEDQMVMKQHIPILDKETFNFKFDGGESWYLTSKIPLYDEKNECIGLLGISHNISERKAMEQKLQTALNNLQNILDATNQVSIIGTDIYGTITIFNKGAEKLLGYSADEVLHKNTPGIFHKLEEVQKRSEELSAEFGETIDGFQVFVHFAKQKDYESREWTYTRKDGSTFPVQLVITVLKDVEGNITGYLGVAVDITTLKNSQIALKQSELQFRALFELSPIGIALIDYSTGNFLDANNSFTNTIGYSKNEILEKNFWNIISSDNKQLQKNIVTAIRDTGLYGPIEGMCSKKNQSKFPVLLNGVQIADTYGKTLLWSVIQDISYIKEKENELNNLNKQIERRNIALQISNEELEQFAYIASHDLQEPLRMISGFLTKLEKKYKNQLDENALQYIFFAVDGAARMRNLITDLLAYSRAGKVDYKTEIVSFEQILTNVVTLLRSQIEEKNAEITWGEMPILRVAKTPIQQLFSNLISNGLKYQKENTKPKINIVAIELEKHWQFSITDNGIGIEPQYFEKVFAIFQRLHNKEQYSGTGIGLAICKKIVTYHHGEIWVQSFPNMGTTFFFTISKEIT